MGRPVTWVLALVLGVVIGYLHDLTPFVPPLKQDVRTDQAVSPPVAARVASPEPGSEPREQQAVVMIEEPAAPARRTIQEPAVPRRTTAAPRAPARRKAELREGQVPLPSPTAAFPDPSPSPRGGEAVSAPAADVTITRAVMDRGQRLLSGEEGRYPSLVAHYPSLGFQGYAQAVRNFGGRFFVRDLDAPVLRAEIDVANGRLIPVDTRMLTAFSPLSRDLSDEPALIRFVWEAERTYGRARYAVLLLVPTAIDAAVLGGLDTALRAHARAPQDIAFVEGEYRRRGADLVLELTSAHARSGEVLPLRAVINLSRMPL